MLTADSAEDIIRFDEIAEYREAKEYTPRGSTYLSTEDGFSDWGNTIAPSKADFTAIINLKFESGERIIQFPICKSTKESFILKQIENRIFNKLVIPTPWKEEGIREPNAAAKEKAFAVCSLMYKEYNLYPDKISATKEEGVFICYDNIDFFSRKSFLIEVYNNLDIAALVNDNLSKKVLYTEDVVGMSFGNAIKIFKESPVTFSLSC